MTSSASTRPSAIATGRKPNRPGKRPSPRRASVSIEKSGRNGIGRFRSAADELELHAPHDGLVTHALVESLGGCVELMNVQLDRVYAMRARERVHMFHEKAANAARLPSRCHHQQIDVQPGPPAPPASSRVLQLE